MSNELNISHNTMDRLEQTSVQNGNIIYNYYTVDTVDIDNSRSQVRGQSFGSNSVRQGLGIEPRSEYHKPLWFGMKNDIAYFTGREEELQKIHNALKTKKKTVVHGLAGSGKTELARKYALEHSSEKKECLPAESYYHTVWITAETKVAMEEATEKLAVELYVPVKREEIKRNHTSLRDSIYELISTKKSLFIFDNVEEISILSDFLPTMHHEDNIFILITSQNDKWHSQTFSTVHLEKMSQNDSIKLVKTLLSSSIPSVEGDLDEDITELVNMLGCLPLAIQLAVAFINEMNEVEQRSIKQYMKHFQTNEKFLLRYENENFNYNKTIHNSMILTMKKIKNDLSLKILFISSYLPPDNVSKDIFKYLVADKMEVDIALKNITRYSLMTLENGYLKIHRLVQSFLKYYIETNDNLNKNDIIKNALNCIIHFEDCSKEHFTSIFKNIEDIDFIIQYYESIDSDKQIILLRYLGVCGHLEALQRIKDDRIYTNEQLFYPILCTAAENGNSAMINLFLTNDLFIQHDGKNKCEVNRTESNPKGLLPVHYAAISGNLHILKILIEFGFSVELSSNSGNTIFHFAVENNHKNIVEYLIDEQHITTDTKDNNGWVAIHFAAAGGHIDILKLLIQRKFPKDLTTNKDHTILHLAVEYGHEKLVVFLLDEEKMVDTRDTYGCLLIHRAAVGGQIDMLKMLINRKFATDSVNNYDGTILHLAVANGHEKLVTFLLDEGIIADTRDNDGNSSVHYTATNGQLDILKMLINRKFATDSINNYGGTILHLAVANGHEKIVIFLLDEGIMVDSKDNSGCSSIHYAAGWGQLDMIKMLINRKFPVDCTAVECHDGETILHLAVSNGHEKVVKFLLDEGIIADTRDREGFTSIHYAAGWGQLDILKMLINRNFSTNSTTDEGFTILHLAVENGYVKLVMFLLDEGIMVDTKDKYGNLSIHRAAIGGQLDMLKMLINRKFATDCVNNEGETILHLAVANGHEKLVMFLLDEGIIADSRNYLGCSSVHYAAERGRLDILKILINKKFSTNSTTNYGETLLHLAVRNSHENIIIFLLNKDITVTSDDVNELSPNKYSTAEGQQNTLTQLIQSRCSETDNAFDKCTTDLLLEYAVRKGNVDIFNSLFYNGCGNIKNVHNYSIFQSAVTGGYLEIIKALLQDGADVNSLDNDHDSPLHSAVHETQQNNLEIVKLLLVHGAHVNIKDKSGKTPLDNAREKGYTDIAELLEKHMKDSIPVSFNTKISQQNLSSKIQQLFGSSLQETQIPGFDRNIKNEQEID